MPSTFKIHPAIGIARLGNFRPADEPDADFFITPESPGALPIECDGKTGLPRRTKEGKQVRTNALKKDGQIVRQAARFRIYAYDDDGTQSEVVMGAKVTVLKERSGQTIVGTVKDISWTVYVANKKAIWYEFQERSGEHGYAPGHTLRNATITDADERRQMIIDPGPQTVATPKAKGATATRASFARRANGNYPQSFPPTLNPNSIDTLGELYGTRDSDNRSRLLVLGGYGNSGSYNNGPGEPKTSSYANNDGWFDDIADGPVRATLTIEIQTVDGVPPPPQASPTMTIDAAGAWVVTAYPAYLPEIENIIRLDEAIYDVAVREQAYDTGLYGVAPFDDDEPVASPQLRAWRENAHFNPDYYPHFWRDIWPVLRRPQYLIYLLVFDPLIGAAPHQTDDPRENFAPGPLSMPPHQGQDPVVCETNRQRRYNIYNALRQPGQQNQYLLTPDAGKPDYRLRGMPELCGDNPIGNALPAKFLTLTRTMLFLLRQWADGKFINECEEGLVAGCQDGMPPDSYWYGEPGTPTELDRGVLSNGLGGSFCPGGEVTWIVRNPEIYSEPFRIAQSTKFTPGSLTLTPSLQTGPADADGNFMVTLPGGISGGLEPGDVTKYNAVPWQTDFNECSIQPIDITYEEFNKTYPASTGDPFPQSIQSVWWWPTHRPLWVMEKTGAQVEWTRGIPQTPTGDMMMVRAWSGLGFVVKNTSAAVQQGEALFYESQRNEPLIGSAPDANAGG